VLRGTARPPARYRNFRIAVSFSVSRILRLRGFQQLLRAGPEQVGAHGEHRVLAVVEHPQLGPHARQQFLGAERLGDVVVGAGIQAADDVALGIGTGQHDDGHPAALLAQLGAEVAAVAIGQADIQQDGIVADIQIGQLGLGVFGILGLDRGKLAVEGQVFGKGYPQRGIVFDDQDRTWVEHAASGYDNGGARTEMVPGVVPRHHR